MKAPQMASENQRTLLHAPKKMRDRAPGKANRYRAIARRYSILADYLVGEKVEVIAALHGVTRRMVHHYVAAEGIQRPQGRPQGQGAGA